MSYLTLDASSVLCEQVWANMRGTTYVFINSYFLGTSISVRILSSLIYITSLFININILGFSRLFENFLCNRKSEMKSKFINDYFLELFYLVL